MFVPTSRDQPHMLVGPVAFPPVSSEARQCVGGGPAGWTRVVDNPCGVDRKASRSVRGGCGGTGTAARRGLGRAGTRLTGVGLARARAARIAGARTAVRGVRGTSRAGGVGGAVSGAFGGSGVVTVKTAAFEDHPYRSVELPQRSGTLRTLGQILVGKRLHSVELVTAGLASVFVGGHVPFLSL